MNSKGLVVSFVVCSSAFTQAKGALEEFVVAADEGTMWLGPDEIEVAAGAKTLWLGPDEIEVAAGAKTLWLGPEEIEVAVGEKEFALVVFRELLANPTADDIRAAIAASGARDRNRILALIGGADDPVAAYSAFCRWADKIGDLEAAGSEHAGDSFALGSESLFENEPRVEFSAVSMSASGGMEVSVTAKDGESTKAVSSEKVAEMFEATRELSDWTGDARLVPHVTDKTKDVSAPVEFTVKPGDGTADKVFLRLKK